MLYLFDIANSDGRVGEQEGIEKWLDIYDSFMCL